MERERALPDRNYETAGLGQHIVARYGRSPGVIPMDATLQRFRRTGLFGHDRLPLLSRLSRYWEGMNHPYPGSGGPLTFLQPSPFASVPAAGAEWIGRPLGSATTATVAPGAPSIPVLAETVPVSPANVDPPSTAAATGPGFAIVQRRRSRPEAPSPHPDTVPAARKPAATGSASVAPVVTETRPADGSFHTTLPLSPADGGLGRPINRRRKHPSPEASIPTTTSVTTETGPALRAGPQSEATATTIRRTAPPLPPPVPNERSPSSRVSAPASPAPASDAVGTVNGPPPEWAGREQPATIDPTDAAPPRGDLGNAIQLRHAHTTIAARSRSLPVSMPLPRQGRPLPVGRSAENVRARAGAAPETSTATAYPISGPRAETEQNHGEQPILEQDPGRRSRAADRLPSALPPTHRTIFRALADNARPHPIVAGAGMGSTDTVSRARSPMPLAVQREPQRFSAEPIQGERFPTTAWQTGNAGRSPFTIGGHRTPTGHGSGAATVVSVEDLRVETEPHPSPAGDGERPNVDDLVDKVFRRLMRRLAVERERRGWQPWF
jgi:hypothetical protein